MLVLQSEKLSHIVREVSHFICFTHECDDVTTSVEQFFENWLETVPRNDVLDFLYTASLEPDPSDEVFKLFLSLIIPTHNFTKNLLGLVNSLSYLTSNSFTLLRACEIPEWLVDAFLNVFFTPLLETKFSDEQTYDQLEHLSDVQVHVLMTGSKSDEPQFPYASVHKWFEHIRLQAYVHHCDPTSSDYNVRMTCQDVAKAWRRVTQSKLAEGSLKNYYRLFEQGAKEFSPNQIRELLKVFSKTENDLYQNTGKKLS